MKKEDNRPTRLVALGTARRETRASFTGDSAENLIMRYNVN